MKIFEKILAGIILLGVILKYTKVVVGADTLIMWGTLLISCIYYPFGFLFFNQIKLRNVFKKNAYAHTNTLKIVMGIVAGLASAIVCIGGLFKILHLTGANEMLFLGLVFTALSLAVATTLVITKKDTTSKFILTRLPIMAVIGMILFFTSELSLVKLQYQNHPAYIEAYTEYLKDPRNEQLLKKRELEYYRIILSPEEFKEYEKSESK